MGKKIPPNGKTKGLKKMAAMMNNQHAARKD